MISFVYFDVGGVVELDFSVSENKWIEMKKVMGVRKEFEKEFDELYDKYEHEELCLTRHVDSLIPVFSEKFGMNFPENFSMLKYFIEHFNKNTSIWQVIAEVKKTSRIGLLTNMYVDMLEETIKHNLLPDTNWDVIVDSTKVGLQKPDPLIFKFAEEQSKAFHSEILFVDNNQKNIDAAKEFGWKTFFYNSKEPEVSSKLLLEYYRANNK